MENEIKDAEVLETTPEVVEEAGQSAPAEAEPVITDVEVEPTVEVETEEEVAEQSAD